MTPTPVTGTLVGLHTVSAVRNETLHFQIQGDSGVFTQDLHTEEGLMFVKAREGQRVAATFTRETGYVSQLRIIAGPNTGYAYNQPDARNTFGAGAICLFGLLLAAVPAFGYITDRQAAL